MNKKILVGAISFSLATTILTLSYLATNPHPSDDANSKRRVCVEAVENRVGANVHTYCLKQAGVY